MPAGVAGAEAPKAEISAAYSVVVLAVVLLNALFRLLEALEVTLWDAANPSAFAVLDLDELRRHADRRQADDDIQTSPVADDCSDPEHGRTRTPRAHNLSIGNLTVRADPSIRIAASIAIEQSGSPRQLDARQAAPCACLARAV